jgi:hypothetical protein
VVSLSHVYIHTTTRQWSRREMLSPPCVRYGGQWNNRNPSRRLKGPATSRNKALNTKQSLNIDPLFLLLLLLLFLRVVLFGGNSPQSLASPLYFLPSFSILFYGFKQLQRFDCLLSTPRCCLLLAYFYCTSAII